MRFSIQDPPPLSAMMSSQTAPPPPPPKGKGKSSATDALRAMAGYETTQQTDDNRQKAADARQAGMKRKVEDLLPRFTDGKGGLNSKLQKSNVTEYFAFAPNQLVRNLLQTGCL